MVARSRHRDDHSAEPATDLHIVQRVLLFFFLFLCVSNALVEEQRRRVYNISLFISRSDSGFAPDAPIQGTTNVDLTDNSQQPYVITRSGFPLVQTINFY